MTAVTKISVLRLKDHSCSSITIQVGDIMGTFTWKCVRTYNFPHVCRTIIRYSFNVVHCVVKKGPLSTHPSYVCFPRFEFRLPPPVCDFKSFACSSLKFLSAILATSRIRPRQRSVSTTTMPASRGPRILKLAGNKSGNPARIKKNQVEKSKEKSSKNNQKIIDNMGNQEIAAE